MVFLTILLMIIIGALIGGVTNSLAIKMLFRPYEPKYLGKWKLPFTPGLIPKRRDELAKQLGKMVVEHLLTAEGISKRIGQESFKQQVTAWAHDEIERQLAKNTNVASLLQHVGIHLNETDVREKITNLTSNYIQTYLVQNRHQKLRDILNEELVLKANSGVNQISNFIQLKLSTLIASDVATKKLNDLINSYLDSKGFFGNMISSFIGNEGLAEKIQPVLVEYSKSEEASDWIHQVVTVEWNRLLDQPLSTLDENFDRHNVGNTIGTLISSLLPIDSFMSKSIDTLFQPIKPQLLYQILPKVVEKALNGLVDRIEPILMNFGLEDIVEKEVSGFPLQRVEQLVLDISRKEFKLITYLGALLGGVIGFVQGLIVVLIG